MISPFDPPPWQLSELKNAMLSKSVAGGDSGFVYFSSGFDGTRDLSSSGTFAGSMAGPGSKSLRAAKAGRERRRSYFII